MTSDDKKKIIDTSEINWTKQIDIPMNHEEETRIELTKEGLKEHRDELKDLIANQRPIIQEQLKEARAQGDLSENADYDAAKEKQAEIEARIQELEDIISRAKIITKTSINKVDLGNKVTFTNQTTKKQQIVHIVGVIESDPMAEIPKISSKSPLGAALMNAKVNDIVKIEGPKTYQVKINKITN